MNTRAESNSINNKISFNWMTELLAAWKLPTAKLSFKPSGIFSTMVSKSDGGNLQKCAACLNWIPYMKRSRATLSNCCCFFNKWQIKKGEIKNNWKKTPEISLFDCCVTWHGIGFGGQLAFHHLMRCSVCDFEIPEHSTGTWQRPRATSWLAGTGRPVASLRE